ncbi:hypothetical protein ACK8P5_26240 (plasmid) [Paenibacillus sp. EC2-1]|uniref:hypothetical protein n=1 Tax=Paenibacillus sp. EC2-1 TaxID=3388665 RepID=UPI003BEF3A0E
MDELMIVVNVVQKQNPLQVYIDNYLLPDGRRVEVQEDTTKQIDLEPIRPFIGQVFEMHVNGGFLQYCRLTGLKDSNGVAMITYDEVGMEEEDIELEKAEEEYWHRSNRAAEAIDIDEDK